MTVAIASSPAKTPRKTRTRKAKKSSVKTVTSTPKYSKPLEIKKVTETNPSKVRPEKPNLTWEDYRDDVKVRWEIHSYEVQELWNDTVKVYNNVKPFVIKTVDYVKDSYDRAFNEK